MEKWFRRLSEVPGVGYQGSPGVDRTRLRGHNAVPKVSVSTWDGKRHESLTWTIGSVSGSASPAQSHGFTPAPGTESPQKSMQRMYEALELPGTLGDYHFIIQRCCGQLSDWRTRHSEPWVFAELEKLCWLDIHLVEAHPNTVASDRAEGPAYYTVTAFSTLIRLYEQEGYLHEALDVAERAERFGSGGKAVEELRAKVANLEAESAT